MLAEIYEAIKSHWDGAAGGVQIYQAFPLDKTTTFGLIRQVPGGAVVDRSTCSTTDMFMFELSVYHCRTFDQCDSMMTTVVDAFENAALALPKLVECVRQRPPFIEQTEKTSWVGSFILAVTVERSF